MKNLPVLLSVMLFGGLCSVYAQETFPLNGPRDDRADAYAFTNATVVVDHQATLEGATLLIRGARIEAVGRDLAIPPGYIEVDLAGRWIYPGLIDIYTSYGQAPVNPAPGGFGTREQIEPLSEGPYNANDAIRSHVDAFAVLKADAKEAEEFRKLGFGAVLSFVPDGVARGTSVLLSLGEGRLNENVLKPRAAAHYSFNKGSSKQSYPVSAMGYVSLLRQTFLDAEWYAQFTKDKPFQDQSLDAWLANRLLPQIFEANSWQALLRADRIGDEFGVQFIIRGGGDEYRRIDLVRAAAAPVIVPVNFPEAMDVEDPLDAYRATLEDLKHWEMAPGNLAELERNGIRFAITTHGLRSRDQFMGNLRRAIRNGLSEAAALRALTTVPAELLGVGDRIGRLKPGLTANFLITSGPLFKAETVVHENWIQGKPFRFQEIAPVDLRGQYTLEVDGVSYRLEVTGRPERPEARIVRDESGPVKATLKTSREAVSISFPLGPDGSGKSLALSGWFENRNLRGRGQHSDGTWVDWKAEYVGELTEEISRTPEQGSESSAPIEAGGQVLYPFAAYGRNAVPQPETILIRNATVWTMEAEGRLENTDVLLADGRIAGIGKNLAAVGARVIDGSGKHLTPGIIDEHSHIATSSINETLTNSGMVRIGDVLNSEDPAIYRALAGGVTTVHVLHGSANPIGGQSATIKLRWGAGPEELKLQGADETIKFALGENVKRSRMPQSIRYPQSRMGVEQVFVDAFKAAREYEAAWQAYDALPENRKSAAIRPRRDLAMEAMVEILNSRRFITCHSYVQSEINMLMHVAEQFGFKVNTFTHILEGYKVADRMAQHGVGGSSFSDWWGYKWEVRYAIPYNAAILHRAGVVTAINSDDPEMMRRLNQEAAKSVKYGGVSEEEALAMVTINPAKLLHLDTRMGSIKVGKDADVVLWSDHPLSIYARPEQTVVDGAVHFDIEEDLRLQEEVRSERARIIARMREAKAAGAPSRPVRTRSAHHFHCEDMVEDHGQ